MTTLYDTDFVAWTQRNAELLRAKRFEEVDFENVAEEIESLGKNHQRELKSRIAEILEHLIKLSFAPMFEKERNEGGWTNSVRKQQAGVAEVLEISPSLRRCLSDEMLRRCYRTASRQVKTADFAMLTHPPEECPFTWEEILGEEGK